MSKFHFLFVLTTVLVLSACSDSSSTKEPEPLPEPPPLPALPTTTNTTGTITGFGSVFVNGVEYETDSTQVSTDDNDSATEDDLQVGMVITLTGTINEDGSTGDATSIHYQEQLKGPLESIDLINNTMMVLGQNITFDELTNLENLILAELNLGDFLEISGYFDQNGNLYATRMEKEDGVETLKVQGIVSALDNNAQTFQLADLIINYSGAIFDDFTMDNLANDLMVRVKGDTSALMDGVFTINKIKMIEDKEEHNNGDARHLEGIITSFTSSASFVVNETTIITDNDTEYEHGTKDSLAVNVRVKIKGIYNTEGQLLAKEIRINQRSDLKIEGLVQATDIDQQTVTVLDVVFQVSDQTKMKDDSDDEERYFDLADLSVNDFVEVKGFVDSEGKNIATKLERKNMDENRETELKGKVSTIVDFTFVIVDVTVHTTEETMFEGNKGGMLNQSQFFEQLVNEMEVKVKGQLIDDKFTASKVEVKQHYGDDDDGDDGDKRTEFRGVIEEIADNSLTISSHKVNVTDTTEYEIDDDDLDAEQFWALAKVGDQAKVKGLINAEGVITAQKIELEIKHQEKVANAKIYGSGSLVEETLTVLNHQIEYDQHTLYNSLSEHLTLAEFLAQAPEWAMFKVKGILRDDVLYAKEIMQDEVGDDVENIVLSAFVEMALDNGAVVAGHTINFTDETKFIRGGKMMDEMMSMEEFFAHLAENKNIELEGTMSFEEHEDGTMEEMINAAMMTFREDD